jgi:hypothetical protein
VPLVPRHGGGVLRRPRGGGVPQPPFHRHQGGSRGAARRGLGLHERAPGHARPGRLASERVGHGGPRALLRRHLPAPRALPRRPARDRARLGGRPRGGPRLGGPVARPPAPEPGGKRGPRQPRDYHGTTRGGGGLVQGSLRPVAGRAARRPQVPRQPADPPAASPPPPQRRPRDAAHGPTGGSGTSWAAASTATPSIPTGTCPTSKRCSTTMRC